MIDLVRGSAERSTLDPAKNMVSSASSMSGRRFRPRRSSLSIALSVAIHHSSRC